MRIVYKQAVHAASPHIVKVSGGRSSAYLLLNLLDSNSLKPSRCDLALFNNTSAEHPATYEFLQRLTEVAESHGLPFYWIEFTTYERFHKGYDRHVRRPAYRLVKPRPYHPKNEPFGFRSDGSVFEEATSHKAFLPNFYQRTCTAHLKVLPSVLFLADWLTPKTGLEHLGPADGVGRMTIDTMHEAHLRAGGRLDLSTFERYKRFVMNCSPVRPAQLFADYSTIGKPASLLDRSKRIAFDRCLGVAGIRADEAERVKRLKPMQDDLEEVVYAPLVDAGVNKSHIVDYWQARPELDLALPLDTEKSNCVFCFMKGGRALQRIAGDSPTGSASPASLAWWQRLESTYRREFVKTGTGLFEDRQDRCASGFFGEFLIDDPNRADYSNLSEAPAAGVDCHCFD